MTKFSFPASVNDEILSFNFLKVGIYTLKKNKTTGTVISRGILQMFQKPKLFKTFTCKLPKEESESVIAIAHELGFSRSQVMRIAIARYIRYREEEKRSKNCA